MIYIQTYMQVIRKKEKKKKDKTKKQKKKKKNEKLKILKHVLTKNYF